MQSASIARGVVPLRITASSSKRTVAPTLVGGACLGLGLWTTTGAADSRPAAPPAALTRLRSVRRQLASFLLSDDLHHSISVNILE